MPNKVSKRVSVTVDVTAKCIAKGECVMPSKCAVALAFRKAGFKAVSVASGRVIVGPNKRAVDAAINNSTSSALPGKTAITKTFKLPRRVSEFITTFDCTSSLDRSGLKPFTFTLHTTANELQRVGFTGTL